MPHLSQALNDSAKQQVDVRAPFAVLGAEVIGNESSQMGENEGVYSLESPVS